MANSSQRRRAAAKGLQIVKLRETSRDFHEYGRSHRMPALA